MKVRAYIASLKNLATGRHVMGEAEICEYLGNNQYIARVRGVRCTAIFNPFTGSFYVDDLWDLKSQESQS